MHSLGLAYTPQGYDLHPLKDPRWDLIQPSQPQASGKKLIHNSAALPSAGSTVQRRDQSEVPSISTRATAAASSATR